MKIKNIFILLVTLSFCFAEININTASKSELTEKLKGVFPNSKKRTRIIERIIEFRQANGPFSSCDDLIKVKGIVKKKLAKIKPDCIVMTSFEKEELTSKLNSCYADAETMVGVCFDESHQRLETYLDEAAVGLSNIREDHVAMGATCPNGSLCSSIDMLESLAIEYYYELCHMSIWAYEWDTDICESTLMEGLDVCNDRFGLLPEEKPRKKKKKTSSMQAASRKSAILLKQNRIIKEIEQVLTSSRRPSATMSSRASASQLKSKIKQAIPTKLKYKILNLSSQ